MSSKDPKYIQNNPIWTQNDHKWAHMSKPEWAEKNLNEIKLALTSSNFNKIFISDAHQCKTWHMLPLLKWRNKCQKKKEKNVFVAHFHKAFRPRPFAPNEGLHKVA